MSELNQRQELLTILMEECAEVSIEAAKIMRFGEKQSSFDTLESEVGDLLCMVKLLEEKGYIRPENVEHCVNAKREKLKKWSDLHGL